MSSLPQAGRTAQEEVVRVYDAKVESLRALQDNWEYMTAKQLSDFALVAEAGIDGADVLNVGCSFPLDEIRFAHRVRTWTATDLGETTIRTAERAAREQLSDRLFARLRFLVADGTSLPFADGSFDVALSLSTVDHVVEPEARRRFLEELARVTGRGGRVVVTVPNRWSRGYATRSRRLPAGERPDFFEHCFSPPEFLRMVRRAGLEPVRFRSSAEIPVLAPRVLLPRFERRPLLAAYNLAARYLGVRMGVLAVRC